MSYEPVQELRVGVHCSPRCHQQKNRKHQPADQPYPPPHPDKKELAFNDIKADLTDCEKNVKLMETEIAAMTPESKF